jgi:hypothetical protein
MAQLLDSPSGRAGGAIGGRPGGTAADGSSGRSWLGQATAMDRSQRSVDLACRYCEWRTRHPTG